MHSYLNCLSPARVLLCFSFSHLLTFCPQQEMEIFPLRRHPQGFRGCWGKKEVWGWHWPGVAMLTPIMSCPRSGSTSLALNQNTPVTWVPGEGKEASQKKEFIAQLNLKDILWDPKKALLWPEGFLPANLRSLLKPCSCWSLSKKPQTPQESPPTWRAGLPNGSCWDTSWGGMMALLWSFKNQRSLPLATEGEETGALWIPHTKRCPTLLAAALRAQPQPSLGHCHGKGTEHQRMERRKTIVDTGN